MNGTEASGDLKTNMPLFLVLFAAMLGSTPAAARSSQTSPPQDAPSSDLPVSVERIRELLARTPAESVLVGLDRQPDYKITVEERRFLKDILESLDVKTGPSPPGGLYAYEIQQQVWNTRNSPLARPYAAFTSGELAQVTMTSILGKLVANYLSHAVLNLSRAEAENMAREEVRLGPLITEFAKTDEDRAILRFFSTDVVIGRPFVTAPGVPAERVAILRQAFDRMLKDPAFRDDAKKAGIDISPVAGTAIQTIVTDFMNTPTNIVTKAKAAMEPRDTTERKK